METRAIIAAKSDTPGARVGLDLTACLTACRPGLPCTACSAACPENAIRVSERSARINPAACSDCGRCAAVCPTGAIDTPGILTANLYECARLRRAEEGAAIVPCLGGLSPAILRDALLGGDVTLIDRGWCDACPVSGGQAAPWAAAAQAVNAEAGTLGIAARVKVRRDALARWRARPAPKPRAADPARRALFNRFAHAGQDSAHGGDALAGLPDRVDTPGLRYRAVQLAALSTGPLPGALFPALAVSGAARDLRTLARLCPTAALSVTEADGCTALSFDATACTQCGDCTATGDLTLTAAGEGTCAGRVVLARRRVATCTLCRMRFTPKAAEATCAACARDNDLAGLAHGLLRRKPTQDFPL